MKKKSMYLLLLIFVLSISVILALYVNMRSMATKKGSFIRFFPSHFLQRPGYLNLGYNSYYIAGLASDKIYLGNYVGSSYLLSVDYNLGDTTHLRLAAPGHAKIAWRLAKVTVDSDDVFLMEGFTPSVLHGYLNSLSMADQYNVGKRYFDGGIPLSPNSFVIRDYDTIARQNRLTKIFMDPLSITSPRGILQKQIDGRFCTDGTMHYNRKLNRFVYVYAYRNQFLCLDSNLHLIYRGKTIDTVSIAHIKLDTIHAEHRITFSEPPLLVNKGACIAGGLLFINSALMAKNENSKTFKASSVIDIYELSNGSYKYSFYISDYKDQKVKDLQVINKTLVVLFNTYLATYSMNL